MTAPRVVTVSGEPLHARADGDRIVVYGPHIAASLTMDEFRAFARECCDAIVKVQSKKSFVEREGMSA